MIHLRQDSRRGDELRRTCGKAIVIAVYGDVGNDVVFEVRLRSGVHVYVNVMIYGLVVNPHNIRVSFVRNNDTLFVKTEVGTLSLT